MTDPSATHAICSRCPRTISRCCCRSPTGPRHAYGMAKAVEGQTGGVRLEIGSLYRILARLTGDGVIEDYPAVHRTPKATRRGAGTTG